MTKTIVELFTHAAVAERVVKALYAQGIDQNAVMVAHTADEATLIALLTTTDMPAAALQRYVAGVERGGTLMVAVVADDEVQRVSETLSALL